MHGCVSVRTWRMLRRGWWSGDHSRRAPGIGGRASLGRLLPPRSGQTPAAVPTGVLRAYTKKKLLHICMWRGIQSPWAAGSRHAARYRGPGMAMPPGDGADGGWGGRGAAVLPEACRGYAIRWRGHEHNNCASSSKFYEMRSTPTYNSITATKTHGKKTPAAIPCGGRGQC